MALKKQISLTPMETAVLKSLFESAGRNGHDFGLIEDVRRAVPKDSLGGVISSLVKKRIVVVRDTVKNDTGTWTQFTWGRKVDDVRTILTFNTPTVAVPLFVPLERLGDLLTSGLEGGIGYWATITKYHKPEGDPSTWEYRSSRDSDVFPHIDYPMNRGGYIILENRLAEDDEPKHHKLDREALERGLTVMAHGGLGQDEKQPDKHWRHHFANFWKEEGDAITGDVLIQCSVLGDIVYG
jgi:hypothetical protein